MALVLGAAISTVFPTPASRLEIDKLIASIPAAMVNLFGKPEKLGTLGGYMSWKYGAIFALGTALWSILALSSTLASESSRGSLDFVAVTPFGKRRVALEKLAAHLTMLAIALVDPRPGHDGQLERRSATRRSATRSRRCPRSASPCGSASSPCSSAGSRSRWRRSSVAPARPASPAS